MHITIKDLPIDSVVTISHKNENKVVSTTRKYDPKIDYSHSTIVCVEYDGEYIDLKNHAQLQRFFMDKVPLNRRRLFMPSLFKKSRSANDIYQNINKNKDIFPCDFYITLALKEYGITYLITKTSNENYIHDLNSE
jgi:hypothetical protein